MSNNPAAEQGSPELRDPMEMYEDREGGGEVMPAEAAQKVEAEIGQEENHAKLVAHSYEAALQYNNADLATVSEGEHVIEDFTRETQGIVQESRAEAQTVLSAEEAPAEMAAEE